MPKMTLEEYYAKSQWEGGIIAMLEWGGADITTDESFNKLLNNINQAVLLAERYLEDRVQVTSE